MSIFQIFGIFFIIMFVLAFISMVVLVIDTSPTYKHFDNKKERESNEDS